MNCILFRYPSRPKTNNSYTQTDELYTNYNQNKLDTATKHIGRSFLQQLCRMYFYFKKI